MEKISLKAPGNYSGPFWSNNFSILLSVKAETSIFVISGFLGPDETLIYGIIFQQSTKLLSTIDDNKTIWEHAFYMSISLKMLDFMFSKLLGKGVPENTEAPSNEILEI